MNLTIIRQPFLLDITNTALDARSRIATENDIWDISNPYVGQYVYCLDNGFTYVITELKLEIVGGITIPDKLVKAYKQLTTKINYRGEYLNEETPLQPAQGDWYHNATEGISYIYQDGVWNIFAKDGESSEQGAPGEDGDGIQFAFYINNNRSEIPDWNKNAEQNDAYYMADFGWSDNATGIDKNNRFEWVSIRTKRNKVWSAYSEPRLWSSWGEDGIDGGGVEYIYYRTKTDDPSIFNDTSVYNPQVWAVNPEYQKYDFVPTSYGWYDNPKGTNHEWKCEWVSQRKYSADEITGKVEFNQLFSTPVLWHKWSSDGVSPLQVSLAPDSGVLKCNTLGVVLPSAVIPSTGISVYIGDSNVTTDVNTNITVTCNTSGITVSRNLNTVNGRKLLTFEVAANTKLPEKIIFEIAVTYNTSTASYVGYKEFVVTTITENNYKYYTINPITLLIKRDKYGNSSPDKLRAWVYQYTPDGTTIITDFAKENLNFVMSVDGGDEIPFQQNYITANIVKNITYRLYDIDDTDEPLYEESIEVLQDGLDGTSISFDIKVADDAARLALTDLEPDTVVYQLDTGHLWVWTQNLENTELVWLDLGPIQGTPGQTAYVHIKYANGTKDKDAGLTWTNQNGEEPGPWMGVCSDNNKNLPEDPLNNYASGKEVNMNLPYTWKYIQGDNGMSAMRVDLYEEMVIVPCNADGSLIEGDHICAGSGTTFTTPYQLLLDAIAGNIKAFYGVANVSEECTLTITSTTMVLDSYLPALEARLIAGFESIDQRVGEVTFLIHHDQYGDITRNIKFCKNYSGKDGAFEYYQLKPNVQLIVAAYNVTDKKYTEVSPKTIYAELYKITQDGQTVVSTLENAEITLSAHNTEGAVSDGLSISIDAVAMDPIDLLTWWDNELPTYVLMLLRIDGLVSHSCEIPVLRNLEGVTVTMPDWVTEWDGKNAHFNGKHVLAVNAYVGDAPTGQSDWTGLLMGSNVASIEGLPWDDDNDDGTSYDFSGIIAVKSFDTQPGDNQIDGETDSDVTFALDAKTGNAYFKGEVHATSGDFTGAVYAEKGVFNGTVYANDGKFTGSVEAKNGYFKNGSFDNCTAQNFTITSGLMKLDSTINIYDGEVENMIQFGGTLFEEPVAIYNEMKHVPFYDSQGDVSLQNIAMQIGGTDVENQLVLINVARFELDDNGNRPKDDFGEVTCQMTLDLYGLFNMKAKNLSGVYEQDKTVYPQMSITPVDIGVSSMSGTSKLSETRMDYLNIHFSAAENYVSGNSMQEGYVGASGICIPWIATSSSRAPQGGLKKGTLYVDNEGVVRVADGKDGYITGA